MFSDYGTQTSLEVTFNEFYDLERLVKKVERMSYKGYRTRIDLAFEIADKKLFTQQGGMRIVLQESYRIIRSERIVNVYYS